MELAPPSLSLRFLSWIPFPSTWYFRRPGFQALFFLRARLKASFPTLISRSERFCAHVIAVRPDALGVDCFSQRQTHLGHVSRWHRLPLPTSDDDWSRGRPPGGHSRDGQADSCGCCSAPQNPALQWFCRRGRGKPSLALFRRPATPMYAADVEGEISRADCIDILRLSAAKCSHR